MPTLYNEFPKASLPLRFHWKKAALLAPFLSLKQCPLERLQHRRTEESRHVTRTMPKHQFTPVRGRIERWSFESELLENRLGDPTEREVLVHLAPEGIEILESGGALPVIIYLAPFTSSGPQRAGWKAFGETLPQRHERLVSQGKMQPVILVMPDTFTSLGGNQFVDSPILGKWSTWLAEALRPEIVHRYATNNRFGLVGKSSGGYGAMVNGMLQPGAWSAIASHSGDVGFELMYGGSWGETVTHIAPDGSAEAYLARLAKAPAMRSSDFHTMMMCALAASYDPRSVDATLKMGVKLPVDLDTCVIDGEAWSRWMNYDPLMMVEIHHKALAGMSLCFVDCGDQDQYHIHYGTRRLVSRFEDLSIPHTYEEFIGTHSGIDHRLDVSFPLLSKALQ